jgi:hypothetical protein
LEFAAEVTVLSPSSITLAAVSQLIFVSNFLGAARLDFAGTGTVLVQSASNLLRHERRVKLIVV